MSQGAKIIALHGGSLDFTNMETGLLVTAQVSRYGFRND